MSGKRVLAAGKFDILHLGHLAYLEQAKKLAGDDGELVVIIARDNTIERERLRVLGSSPQPHRTMHCRLRISGQSLGL